MSYQLPIHPHPGTHSNIPESSQNQEVILAKEKVRKIIEGQHADLKRKFDQIRQSLSEKEEKVNQELDEILTTRLNELDMCARNINLLNETCNINQQKLGTNTLGTVNFKILTTVTASIEEFRKKIDTELNIRILWGSHDIEQSIQNICTLSYMSDPQDTHSTVSKPPNIQTGNILHYKCTYCQNYFPSLDQLHAHKCNDYPEQLLTFQKVDNQIHGTLPPHTSKEPFSVQPVYPTVFLPVEGPITPRATEHARMERDNSLELSSLYLCTQCGQYFSSTRELENHQRELHSLEIITSSYRKNSVHRENVLERQQQHFAVFSPVREKITPPQSSQPYPEYTAASQLHLHNQQAVQHYETSTPQSPAQGSQLPNNLMNQGIHNITPQTQLQTNVHASQHYVPSHYQAIQNANQYPAVTPAAAPQHQYPAVTPAAAPQHQYPAVTPAAAPQHQYPAVTPATAPQHQYPAVTPAAAPQYQYPAVTEAPQYQTVAQPPQTQASHALNIPNPHFHYPTQQHQAPSPEIPYPRNVVTEPISPSQNFARIQNQNLKLPQPFNLPVQNTSAGSSNVSSNIRNYRVRLIWYKQVETLVDCIFYFDNYNGCCDLQWDRRNEYYCCMADLEEGEHFGQLSLSDSEMMYTVEKFTLPMIQSTDAEPKVLILKIIQNT